MGENEAKKANEMDENGENKIIEVDFTPKKCEILPFESPMPPAMTPGYVPMPISASQMAQISAFCKEIPTLMAANTLKDAYCVVRWPEGLPHNLVKAKNGPGYYSMVRGDKGQFGGHAQFGSLTLNAAVLAGFTAMSIVTSQYFLAEINQQMSMMNKSIDKILDFLYGDKRAELLAEISFVKYAYQNYASIMECGDQRIATIQGLQEAKKTAIQDIEFYSSDLSSTVREKDIVDMVAVVNKAFQIKDCLELAMQLYTTATLLEVYYAQNGDPSYLSYVEQEGDYYIDKCKNGILSDMGELGGILRSFRQKRGKQFNSTPLRERVAATVEELKAPGEYYLKTELRQGLYSAEQPAEYCICSDGTVYLKKA